jgi:elongation factor P--(R)-beta-lysine ligase
VPEQSKFLYKIKSRANMLWRCRKFFADKDILEVDVPLITELASVDEHIDLIPVEIAQQDNPRYLISSPEYSMKRLIAYGCGDIYSLSHVFRQGEIGSKHQSEFSMAEWYRLGFSFEQMQQETLDFVQLFFDYKLPPAKYYHLSEIFEELFKTNPFTCSKDSLIKIIKKQNIPFYPNLQNESRDSIVNFILSELVEPQLPHDIPTIIDNFLPQQAALAQIEKTSDGYEVAKRFEIYFKGLELANGYLELCDAKELQERFENANIKRNALNKSSLPIDKKFLQDLTTNTLPNCCGVAVGFDRLMMLKHNTNKISDVISIAWDQA